MAERKKTRKTSEESSGGNQETAASATRKDSGPVAGGPSAVTTYKPSHIVVTGSFEGELEVLRDFIYQLPSSSGIRLKTGRPVIDTVNTFDDVDLEGEIPLVLNGLIPKIKQAFASNVFGHLMKIRTYRTRKRHY